MRAVASERYPVNPVCAHPGCAEAAVDPHHIFPRSLIAGDSYFVEITEDGNEQTVIPHVSGLCRAHHDDVEQHRAWIRLEDGVYVWHDRGQERPGLLLCASDDSALVRWEPLGPLDPQPAGREKAHKPKRKRLKGEARRARTTISIKVPKDEAEDGAGVLFDCIGLLESKRGFDPPRPPYYTLVDALAYTVLNAGPEDFA